MMTRNVWHLILIIPFTFSSLAAQNPAGGIAFGGTFVNVNCGSTAFGITTPEGWVSDTAFAHQLGLKSFFYPVRDTASLTATYFYATGYPKLSDDQNLQKFVTADLTRYYENYPDIKQDSISIDVPSGVIAAKNYIFTGFKKRYGEQTIFMESKSAILVIIFSAKDEADYRSYLNAFNKFFGTFRLIKN